MLGTAQTPHVLSVGGRRPWSSAVAKCQWRTCVHHGRLSPATSSSVGRRHQSRQLYPGTLSQVRPAHHAPRRAELRASALGTKWRVRPLAQEELLQAAEIQFEGFHRRQNFPPLDALARMTFRAEVLSTLKQKLQYNTPDSFACLVAERCQGERATVGIADVSLQGDKEVLRKLPEPVQQYAYLSSMAVDRTLRRQGAAQALLAAAERTAATWKQPYLALHLHDDNKAALQLYLRSGFVQLDKQQPFMGRGRILMAKPVKR